MEQQQPAFESYPQGGTATTAPITGVIIAEVGGTVIAAAACGGVEAPGDGVLPPTSGALEIMVTSNGERTPRWWDPLHHGHNCSGRRRWGSSSRRRGHFSRVKDVVTTGTPQHQRSSAAGDCSRRRSVSTGEAAAAAIGGGVAAAGDGVTLNWGQEVTTVDHPR